MKLISFVSLVVFGVGVYGIPDAIGQTPPVETVAPQGDTTQLKQLGQTLNSSYSAFNQSLNQTFQDLNNWLDNQDQLAVSNLNSSYSQLQALIAANELLKESLKNRPDYQNDPLYRQGNNVAIILARILPILGSIQGNASPTAEQITAMQKALDFFERENIPDSDYGFYGPTTHQELQKFLRTELGKLDNQISQLNGALNQAVGAKTETPLPLDAATIAVLEHPLFVTLSKELEYTTEELQNIEQQLAYLDLRQRRVNLFLSCFFSLFLLVTIALVLYNRYTLLRLNHYKNNKTYQLTTNDLKNIQEDVVKLLQPLILEQITSSGDQFLAGKGANLDKAIPPNPLILDNDYDHLVKEYNEKSGEFQRKMITVTPAKQDSNLVLFNADTDGLFCLLSEDSQETQTRMEYLFPHHNFPLQQEEEWEKLQLYFEVYGEFSADNAMEIELIKPARVSMDEDSGQWEFIQSGILKVKPIPQGKSQPDSLGHG